MCVCVCVCVLFRLEITEKLQGMMQSHCNDTLRLLQLGSHALHSPALMHVVSVCVCVCVGQARLDLVRCLKARNLQIELYIDRVLC